MSSDRSKKHKINNYYPSGEKLLGWWQLFDEFINEDKTRVELLNIGESRRMKRGTGGCQYKKWSGYQQRNEIKGTFNNVSKSSLALISEGERMLIDAYEAEFDAEDVYRALSMGLNNDGSVGLYA